MRNQVIILSMQFCLSVQRNFTWDDIVRISNHLLQDMENMLNVLGILA